MCPTALFYALSLSDSWFRSSFAMSHVCGRIVIVSGPYLKSDVFQKLTSSLDVTVLWRGKQRNLARSASEPAQTMLRRLAISLLSEKPSKNKKKVKHRDGASMVLGTSHGVLGPPPCNPKIALAAGSSPLNEHNLRLVRSDGSEVTDLASLSLMTAFRDASVLEVVSPFGVDQLGIVWNPLHVENLKFFGDTPVAG